MKIQSNQLNLSGAAALYKSIDLSFNSSATTSLLAASAGTSYLYFRLLSVTAFDSGTASFSIGVDGTQGKYLSSGSFSLTTSKTQLVYPEVPPLAAAEEIKVFYDRQGATVGKVRIELVYNG